MDTELLKTFLEVDKTRHFGRAADNLYLTHAAVGARIRQLENLVGTPVFNRQRNNVSLTPAGERLKPYAQEIIDSWNRALQESSLATGHSRQLTVGGTPNIWQTVLKGALSVLHQKLGEVNFRAECHSSEFLTAQLLGRQIDILVLFDPLKLDGVIRKKVGEMQLILVSSMPELTAQMAFSNQYVQINWGVNFDLQHSRLPHRPHRPVLLSSTCDIGLDYLLQNEGTAYLPESVAGDYLDRDILYRVADAIPLSQDIYITFLEDITANELLSNAAAGLEEIFTDVC